MDSGLAWPGSSEIWDLQWVEIITEHLDDCFATTRICELAVKGVNRRNTLHLLSQCISTNWNHLVPDIEFWAVNWTWVEVSRNVTTLRTMANVLDKCSVRISLSTNRPPNLVVIISHPFCRSRVVSGGSWFVALYPRYTALSRWNHLDESHAVFKSSHS